jgi:hypothetical protein
MFKYNYRAHVRFGLLRRLSSGHSQFSYVSQGYMYKAHSQIVAVHVRFAIFGRGVQRVIIFSLSVRALPPHDT